MRCKCLLGLALLAIVLAWSAHLDANTQQKKPTVDQFLSPAFSFGLVSAKNADRIAWIAYDRGLRNVYTAAAPDFKVVRLTSFLEDDGNDLTDYGKARRDGLRISSALAESGMNHLINQRMGKRQLMRWSADGAHALLQVRCALLDNRMEALFREWFPRFRATPPMAPAVAA